jgi:hypothetical protein
VLLVHFVFLVIFTGEQHNNDRREGSIDIRLAPDAIILYQSKLHAGQSK